jgi:hypothetical protein
MDLHGTSWTCFLDIKSGVVVFVFVDVVVGGGK